MYHYFPFNLQKNVVPREQGTLFLEKTNGSAIFSCPIFFCSLFRTDSNSRGQPLCRHAESTRNRNFSKWPTLKTQSGVRIWLFKIKFLLHIIRNGHFMQDLNWIVIQLSKKKYLIKIMTLKNSKWPPIRQKNGIFALTLLLNKVQKQNLHQNICFLGQEIHLDKF